MAEETKQTENKPAAKPEKPLPVGIPNRFVHNVRETDGANKKTRVLEGQILVCEGCCCGKVETGHPALPLDEFKREWKERGVRLRVHLTVTGCLGPCPLANVILVIFDNQSIWLHSINSPAHVTAIYDYIEKMLDAEKYLPPDGMLEKCHFNRFVSDTASDGRWEEDDAWKKEKSQTKPAV